MNSIGRMALALGVVGLVVLLTALTTGAPIPTLASRAPAAALDSPIARPALFTQTLVLGGQRLLYAGDQPLRIESGVYWDTPPAAAHLETVVDSAGPHLLVTPGPADPVRFIVQLDGEPLAARRAVLESPVAARRAADDLRAAQAGVLQSLDARGIAVQVRQQYVHAYNGLALTARAGDRDAIARTPGVRAVYPDYEVDALLPQSVPLIGAPAVWAMHDAGGQPVTGRGVRVAVIDSGIDYNHPDLGGPGFPNARVITGYNVISDTLDPWDDFGHGTHVAGIVGASGGVTGVAPAASLMAYKVFDSQGHTTTSIVIAAIERALDPDGDAGTADGAHVLNLSLGDAGHPDDPLSQACDNAVLAGAVVVAGAGNSGPRYGSMLSPGLARRVIGVGATDKADALWYYTSRGPVPSSWAIKPDLVAPGVDISSTVPGGGYVTGTGTSASTAHTAGAAALLRQLHPTWSPAQVQAALMNTAKDLGRSPFDQGAGRLQVNQAAATPALILPPSLSLGRVDPAQPVWTHQVTLTVQNVSTATVTYTLSTVGSFPAGVTRTLSPAQVVVTAGGSAVVTFTVSVNTATVPDKTTAPYAYWGAVRAVPAGHAAPTLRVPFAFVKAPLLRLHVDEAPIAVMFLRHDPLTSWYVSPATTTSEHLLPPGTYDVVAQYTLPYAYVLGTVELTQTAEVTLPRAAAVYQARIAFTDETGQTAVPNHALHRFMRGGNGWLVSEVTTTAPITEIVRFSAVPTTYVWERTVACADPTGDAYRQWHGRAVGIASDLEFLTAPTDFARVDHPLRAAPGVATYTFWELIGYAMPNYAYMVGPTVHTVTMPYTRRAYYRAPPPGHELYTLRLALPDPLPATWEGVLLSPWLQLDADHRLTWQQPRGPLRTYYRVLTGGAEPLGLGPLHGFAQFVTTAPTATRLLPAEGTWLYFRACQGGDVSWETRQPYELWQDGVLVQAGDIGASTGGAYAQIDLPVSGTYTLTLPFTYTLGATDAATGHGRMSAVFDSRQYAADANPPFVTVLRILENDRPTDTAVGPVELRLVVTDTTSAPTVTVAYAVGAGWTPVTVTQAADEYVAHLPGFPAGTAVHLRIVAADAAGNALTHELLPAYRVRWLRLYLPLVLRDAR